MKLLIGILFFYTGFYYKSINEEMVGGLFNFIGYITIILFLCDVTDIYQKWSKKRMDKWKAEQEIIQAEKDKEQARIAAIPRKKKIWVDKVYNPNKLPPTDSSQTREKENT